jgi:hypothetical protein
LTAAKLGSIARCILIVFAAACDPGYTYSPQAADGTKDTLIVQTSEFELAAPMFGGLVGETWLFGQFEIRRSTARIIPRSAILRGEKGITLLASWPEGGVIRPGDRVKSVTWRWDFGDYPVPEVLGRSCIFELVFDLEGGKSDTVRVVYRQTE